jgi:prepilin-type N-terminal cleavage/methylation domain-containing protein
MRFHVRTRGQRGFNLIEVIVAMGMLASVLVVVLGLFIYARRNVYSGKEMTRAVSVGTRVTEDLSSMDKSALRVAFGLPATVGGPVTVAGQSFTNSFKRTTKSISSTTDPNHFLERWRDLLTVDNKFQNPEIVLVITPSAGAAVPATLGSASIVHIRAFVIWEEFARQRHITIDQIKVQRE